MTAEMKQQIAGLNEVPIFKDDRRQSAGSSFFDFYLNRFALAVHHRLSHEVLSRPAVVHRRELPADSLTFAGDVCDFSDASCATGSAPSEGACVFGPVPVERSSSREHRVESVAPVPVMVPLGFGCRCRFRERRGTACYAVVVDVIDCLWSAS